MGQIPAIDRCFGVSTPFRHFPVLLFVCWGLWFSHCCGEVNCCQFPSSHSTQCGRSRFMRCTRGSLAHASPGPAGSPVELRGHVMHKIGRREKRNKHGRETGRPGWSGGIVPDLHHGRVDDVSLSGHAKQSGHFNDDNCCCWQTPAMHFHPPSSFQQRQDLH